MDGWKEGRMGDRQQRVDACPVAVFETTGMLVQGKYCVCLSPQLFFCFFPGLVNVLQLTNSPVSIPSAAWNPHREALIAHLFLSRSFVGVFLAPTSPAINYSEASGGAKPVVTSVQAAPRFSFFSPPSSHNTDFSSNNLKTVARCHFWAPTHAAVSRDSSCTSTS